MARTTLTEMISVNDAARLGVSRLVRDAEDGQERVLLRRNRPIAAIVSIRRIEELEEMESDLSDLALATAHVLTTGEERRSLDDVLAHFGYPSEHFRALYD